MHDRRERSGEIWMKKWIMKLGKRQVAICSVAVFLLSMLPLLYMCKYVHASGDDYGYGAWTHAAWLDTRSLWEVLKAAGRTVRKYYYGWQGTWSSVFLFTLQPEVFSQDAYWIVPFLMSGLTIAGVSLLVYYFMVEKVGFSKSVFATVDCCLLFGMLQFIPRTKSALFWYNGTAHYIVPFFMALLAIYCFYRYIDTYRFRYWMISLVCMFFLGGASYLSALLAPIILVLLLLCYAGRRRRSLLLLIPLAVEGIGLAISMAAPGNRVRGGDELAFSVGKALDTVLESFRLGGRTVGEYWRERPVIYIILLFIAVVVWEALLREETDFEFRNPAVFTFLLFGTWCAMFSPGIYAGTEVSGGVPNTIFQVFLLLSAAIIIYDLGWLYMRMKRKYAGNKQPFWMDQEGFRWKGAFPIVLLCGILVIVCRSYVRDSTMIQCIEYVMSGQAEDYKAQMEERFLLLSDDTRKEVILPQINQEQGPLMHMEVLPDPNAWTNQVACEFYRKDKIIGVERKN